jgi:GAF domain-containing protein
VATLGTWWSSDDWSTWIMNPPDSSRLGSILSDLAVTLLTQTSLKEDLQRLARLATDLIEDCSGASISMVVEGLPTTVAATDRVSLEIDVVQYEADSGPCVVSLGGEMIRIGYIPHDERFPHFAIGAADRRVLSSLSLPAIDHGVVVGSLNLYSRKPDTFAGEPTNIALVLAAEVANAIAKSVLLATASQTRDALQAQHDEAILVARASGIMTVVHDCSAATAERLLRNAANDNGEALIKTAERILANTSYEAPDLDADEAL